MKLIIVIFISSILFFLYFLKRNKLSNILLTTFTLMWVAVLSTIVLFNNAALQFMTLTGLFIIFAHIFMVICGVLFFLFRKSFQNKAKDYFIKIPIKTLYFLLLLLSFIGIYTLLSHINLKDAILNNELANLRGDMLSKEVEIPIQATVFMNFLYPFAIITPIFSFLINKRKHYLFLSFLIFGLFSLSSGGKGGIVILTILMFGAIIFLIKHKLIKIDKTIKYVTAFLVFLIFAFMTYINSTRSFDNEKSNVFVTYLSNSVPSFCQLLIQKDWSLLDFNFNDHIITRVTSGLMGSPRLWQMDKNIVYVPDGFNVFSSFADSIYSLGLIGSLVYYFFMGVLMSYANKKAKNINKIFLFSILFLFSFYSFFVDVFYFMAGSWYCILFYFFIGIKQQKYFKNEI
ncbi:MAG: O-antigen polymerase [Lutibacter sp.]|nr:O-antigen polymerase [Lutibacter sp.]